ncbi:MAG TPA: hypothetical protein VHR41_10345 [Gemmatimonadales bacterium]|jgi:hypothetical protein|nr:hypothetical protein [Gemmatimonadales bacterium]
MNAGMPFEQFLITLSAIIGTIVVLRGPIGRALAARIEGQRPLAPAEAQELEELRTRVLSLEEARGQLAELQERQDFTERLLARQARAPELPQEE